MASSTRTWTWTALAASAAVLTLAIAHAQQPPPAQQPAPRGATSYMAVDIKEPFATTLQRMKAAQPAVQKRQADLLAERYDLANRAATGVTMSRGKPVQEGVRVKLPAGTSWTQLAGLNSNDIRERGLFPKGFLPLPHPNHPEGGMLFPKFAHRGDQEAGSARPDALRPRLRPARPPAAGVPGGDLPDDAARSRRRLARQACHHRQLLRAVQRHPQSQAARRPAPAAHAVPAAAVQPDRGPPHREGEPRRRLLRLPRQRPHQRRHPPGRRHPPAGVPPPHRHADAARRQHPAPVRLAARAEDGRGLHRVRAARRLLRRRSGDRHQEGRQRARARQPGALHGRVPGPARLPAGAQARPVRQARSRQGDRGRAARPGGVLRQGPVLGLPHAAVLHRQPDAQPAGRAVLQAADDQRPHGHRRTARSRPSRCAASRIRRPTCTTAGC